MTGPVVAVATGVIIAVAVVLVREACLAIEAAEGVLADPPNVEPDLAPEGDALDERDVRLWGWQLRHPDSDDLIRQELGL